MTEISISTAIFDTWPTFHRGLVVAHHINNRHIDPDLVAALNSACEGASSSPIDLKTDPRVIDWDDAHRAFNSNPNRFPPAHKALQKRVQKPGVALNPISAIISIMNYNSIYDVIPVGGDDLHGIPNKVELKIAEGDEVFVPLGQSDIIENPEPGEVIYWHPESRRIMCRRWNWRNSHTTRITEETVSMIMNVDGIGDNAEQRARQTTARIAEMMQQYCQADVTTSILSSQQPVFQMDD